MPRAVTLFTGQWADLRFEEACSLISAMGYDGIEACTQSGHIDVGRIEYDTDYLKGRKEILKRYGLSCHAVSAHLAGQCVGGTWDDRLDGFAPLCAASKPDEISSWAVGRMKLTARAAKEMGCNVVTGFMGNAGLRDNFMEKMTDDDFDEIVGLWSPILDAFDGEGVKFALEIHPGQIAFDYYSAQKLFQKFDNRAALGINLNPANLVWNMMDPAVFIRDFAEKIYHVRMKDVKLSYDGRSSVMGSRFPMGDTRRGWNFVSLGHGNVDFDSIIRELNRAGYDGPLSVEWEDMSMDRVFGATESCAFTKKINFC